jgi:CMP-N-acetylneuraminic acid synthetase
VVATLIARGGGSTFYRKNTFPLLGKPVILHAIEILQATSFITDIFLWTEDEEIKSIGENAGVNVLERPKAMVHYASGFHTLEDWYHNRASQIHAHIGQLGEFEVGYNCNNILVRPQSLDAMYEHLKDNADKACRIQAVVRVEAGLCLENSKTHGLFPFWNDPERPEEAHPPLYRMVGVTVNDRVKCSDSRYKTLYYEIPREEGLDFQHEDDVALAEFYLGKRVNAPLQRGAPCV